MLAYSPVTAQIALQSRNFHIVTKKFSRVEKQNLDLDIYFNGELATKCSTILFVYGSGFVKGRRDDNLFEPYFNFLLKNGFKVVAIDYRLELNGKKQPTFLNTAPLRDAIDTAVKDLFNATDYIIRNSVALGIDTSMIILSGSSAGAITVLHANYYTSNNAPFANILPDHFKYKGVIAFAGAIMSYTGAPNYLQPPAPTMFFHGTEDKVVPYNKLRLLNRGFFGSRYLANLFDKKQFPYYFQYVQGMGHEIAGLPMNENLPDILWFIENYIFKHKKYFVSVAFRDADRKGSFNIVAPK